MSLKYKKDDGTYITIPTGGAAVSDDKVDKSAIDYTGITSQTYEPMFGGEFTVTTVEEEGYLSPYALATVTGEISKHYTYRITINGTQYILPCDLDNYVDTNSGLQCYEYLGKLGLRVSDTSYVTHDLRDVPFLIMSRSSKSLIEVFTDTTGTYTILIEKIVRSGEKLPNYLLYGDDYFPIEFKKNENSSYNGISVGSNALPNTTGTVAIGYANTCSAICAQAIGNGCTASGLGSQAGGAYTTASGNYSHTEGYMTTASGNTSHSEGSHSVASGDYSHAENLWTVASGRRSHAEGYGSTASGSAGHAEGHYTTAAGAVSHAEGSYTSAENTMSHAGGFRTKTAQTAQTVIGYANDPQTDSIFEVGNGLDANGNAAYNTTGSEPVTRQNAFRVTQDGKAIAQTDVQLADGTSLSAINQNLANKINRSGDSVSGELSVTTLSFNDLFTGNIDTLSNSNGYMFRCRSDVASGTFPTDIIGGNAFLIIGFSYVYDNGLIAFGVQMAIGFGDSKIAIRNVTYNPSGSTWGAWRGI